MSETTFFDDIRTAAAAVAEDAEFVHINEARLAAYAAQLELEGLPPPSYDREHHYWGSVEDTVAFQLTLDSINFGSGYFPHLRKIPGKSGYHTIAFSLKEWWDEEGPFPGDHLRSFTSEDTTLIFGQKLGGRGPAQELMDLFAQALNDLGQWLGERYDDDFMAPVEAACGSAAALAASLTAMPFYQDVARYRGREVPLYKRAQIVVTDLAIAFDNAGPGAFHDLDDLTIFADNLVPHVLRVDGVLDYDPSLLARINAGDLIDAGSPEEVEIRAVALHAVERMVDELRASGVPISARQLDYLLWNRGGGQAYKAQPRHRTRTVYY
jgi:hypothetical protein